MKNFNLSVLSMLSAVAITFTSCLDDDSDNDTYIMGTGTVRNSTSVLLDNGLLLNTSSLSITAGDRLYIYGSVDYDAYESAVSQLNNGSSYASLSLNNIYVAGTWIIGDLEIYDDFTSATATEVDDVSWLTYTAFGNGYMQFSVDADWYYYYSSSSSSYVLFNPEITLFVEDFDASDQTLDLVLVYNSRESETDDNYIKSNSEIVVSFDVTDLYDMMTNEGLSDSDEITLTVKYVTDEDYTLCTSSQQLTGSFGTSVNYCYVSSFDRVYDTRYIY